MIEFGQPAALWTALSIGLPILAHMAYRRVSEKFYFPSLRFIRPSQIPRTGKRTPSDIPLLLLRILLFITLKKKKQLHQIGFSNKCTPPKSGTEAGLSHVVSRQIIMI